MDPARKDDEHSDARFWDATSGMRELQPGLDRFNSEAEDDLAAIGFSPRGPAADRHGSIGRTYISPQPDGSIRYVSTAVGYYAADRLSLTFTVGIDAPTVTYRSSPDPISSSYHHISAFKDGAFVTKALATLRDLLPALGCEDTWNVSPAVMSTVVSLEPSNTGLLVFESRQRWSGV
jgi:hypothetical protein